MDGGYIYACLGQLCPLVLFRVLIPWMFLFEWVTRAAYGGKCRSPHFLHSLLSVCSRKPFCSIGKHSAATSSPGSRPTPTGQTKGPQSGIKRWHLVWGRNYTAPDQLHFLSIYFLFTLRESKNISSYMWVCYIKDLSYADAHETRKHT